MENVRRELRTRTRQQAAVAALGDSALAGATDAALFDEAARLVAENLGVEFSAILQLLPGEKALLLRAGVGWPPGFVGRATLGTGRESHAGYAIETNHPVVIRDLAKEKRFRPPALLREHGVRSGLSVLIRRNGSHFGVLGAYTARRRLFTADHLQFLQAVANVIGLAERQREPSRVREQRALLLGRLTGREREILGLLASGHTNRQIATRLGIGYSTVRGYVRGVIEKLDVHSEIEAVARARALSLLDDRP